MLRRLSSSRVRLLIVMGALGVLGCIGCRIRDYMVPWIVEGELEKIETQKAHRCVNFAQLTRGNASEQTEYMVDFAPPDRLRFEFQRAASAQGAMVLCVSTERYLLYDAVSNRAERIVNLPPFSKETFIEFRKVALRNTLEQNKVYAENAEDEPDQYWEIRTVPKSDSDWSFETVSYISKETKNNVRGLERGPSGEVLNRFETREKTYDVDFPPEHFSVRLPDDCAVVEYDLSALSPFKSFDSGEWGWVPLEHGGLVLARADVSPTQRLFDYTVRQQVLFYAERHHGEQPLLRSPISREVNLAGGKAYINYGGSYTTCRWRSGEWDRLVFTSLGPEQALAFAKRVPPALQAESLRAGPQPAGARDAPGERS